VTTLCRLLHYHARRVLRLLDLNSERWEARKNDRQLGVRHGPTTCIAETGVRGLLELECLVIIYGAMY